MDFSPAHHRKAFERDGFVVLRGLLPRVAGVTREELMGPITRRCEGLFRGEFETQVYPDEWHWREGMSLPKQTKEICNAWKSDLYLARKLVLNAQLGKAVCELMNWKAVRIAQDDVILKPPGGGTAVGLHQDSTYISNNFVGNKRGGDCLSVTMWIPLNEVDEGNGSLTYLVGSHRGIENTAPTAAFHTSTSMTERMDYKNTQTVVMSPGDVVIHHESTWHFSRPNMSTDRARNAVVIHFLRGGDDGDEEGVRFVSKPSYIYARYKLYRSLELREEFFPTVYPPSAFCLEYLSGALSKL